MIYDTIVIGSGLFGSMITRGLRSIGRNVLLVGDKNPKAGSPPAACLVNSAWTQKLGTPVIDRGMEFLTSNFNYQSLNFVETTQSGKVKNVAVGFVRPSEMLLEPDLDAYIDTIRNDNGTWQVHGYRNGNADGFSASQVVVAAGVWSQKLVPWLELDITGKAGCAFLYPESVGSTFGRFMSYWAPYKQIVGFQRGDGFWINDGSAILQRNWTFDHQVDSWNRCMVELRKQRGLPGVVEQPEVLYGIRPYTKTKPCLCEEVTPGLWVAVGAAKNGTLLGGYCASLIQEKSQ